MPWKCLIKQSEKRKEGKNVTNEVRPCQMFPMNKNCTSKSTAFRAIQLTIVNKKVIWRIISERFMAEEVLFVFVSEVISRLFDILLYNRASDLIIRLS